MLNYETFNKQTQPTESELKNFIGINQFTDLHNHLRERYKINPQIAYSNCAMDNNIWRGWNIKYQKSGKSLCTIYPQQGYFLASVPGKFFEVRNDETLLEVKLAVEIRKDEISSKRGPKKWPQET